MAADTTNKAPKSKKSKKRKKKLWIITAVVAVIVIAALIAGFFAFRGGKEDDSVLASSDYTVAEIGEISTTLQVSGTVDAAKTESLTTTLTGPISSIAVKVGQRVNSNDLLATVDVKDLRQELNDQVARQADSVLSAQSAVEKAQQAYRDQKQLVDRGLDGSLNGAQAAVRQADQAYDDAQRAYEQKLNDRRDGLNEQLRSQQLALEQSRSQVLSASLSVVRSGIGSVTAIAQSAERARDIAADRAEIGSLKEKMAEADGAEKKALEAKVTALEQGIEAKREQTPLGIDEGQVNAHLGSVEALSGLNTSIQSLADQQKSFELGLRQLDRELADAQRGVARAFEAKTDAAVSLEAAKLQSEQQLQQAADAVADAQRTLDSAGNQAQSSVQKLRDDIDSNEIRAPFPGLVTVVSGKEGAPAQGPVVTIADDSTLVIKTSVRENEVPKLKIGNPVRFTTRATGDAEFTGEVSFISPVSEKIGQAAAADAKGPSTGGTSAEPPMFPIEITVTGNTEGLKIGGSAKAEITLDKVENTLVVPRGAVIDGPTSKEVLRIGDNNVIERVKVEVGTENDFSVAVTGGDLKSGDRIISNASSRRDMVGQSVDINDSPMPGGDGPQSGTGDEEDSDSAGNKVEKEGE